MTDTLDTGTGIDLINASALAGAVTPKHA